MKVNKYMNAEWKDKQEGSSYLHAYNSEDIKLKPVPTLLVGIGGTGIESILNLKRKLEILYNPKSLEKLEYLLIDTDDIGEDAHINKEDKIIIQSADTAMLLHERKDNSEMIPDEIKSWISEDISPFNVMNGAAGIRQAGRLILFLNIQRVYRAIQKKIQRVSVGYDLSKTRVQVYIFTGIGGGTGSGMFVDISYLIRYVCCNAELNGIVFMPDVSCMKPGLREVTKNNIKRNGFAALKELEYLMMLERYEETFEQKYPGIGLIKTKVPIFDYCILVGSKETGRRQVASEEIVFNRVTEYMISELQAKISNTFGIESFKSNLVYMSASSNCFYDRYCSVGADSRYVAIDYYYSRWLADVMDEINRKVQAEAKPKEWPKESPAVITMQDEMMKWADEVVNNDDLIIKLRNANGKDATRKFNMVRENFVKTFKSQAQEPEKLCKDADTLLYILRQRNLRSVISQILGEKIEEVNGDKERKKKERNKAVKLLEIYIDTYLEEYSSEFEILDEQNKKFLEILHAINDKCKGYQYLPLDNKIFLFHEQGFLELREKEEYKTSVSNASGTILNDYAIHSKKWLGESSLNDRIEWLSDYIAELINPWFERSGCKSINRLLDEYEDGAQMRQIHLETIVNMLDSANQLWPTTAKDINSYNTYETLSVPNKDGLPEWAEGWAEKSNSETAIIRSDLEERFSKILFAAGYSMCDYEGLPDFETTYINAKNKVGVHLYASKDKNWEELPSPYFESKWNIADKSIRENEKKRNDFYRKVFEEALKDDIIFFETNRKKYCFNVKFNGNDQEVVKKNENHDRMISIGDIDIESKDKDIAKNMFIHMFTYRNKIAEKLNRSKI